MALLARQRLTKSFFMAQRSGTFVTSNCYQAKSGQPVFAEVVAELPERLAQWERIKAAKANGRLCNVFRSREDREQWLDDARARWAG